SCGEYARADAAAGRAAREADTGQTPLLAAHARLAAGYARSPASPGEAADELARAADAYREVGHVALAAPALRDAARLARRAGDGKKADALRARAREAFAKLGNREAIRRLEAEPDPIAAVATRRDGGPRRVKPTSLRAALVALRNAIADDEVTRGTL